jgi:paraquat-inducible protein B
MSQPANHWKLGLFILAALLLGVGAVFYLGTRAMIRETISCRSYFDEAVTGLEVGSSAKFRGVTVGQVSTIEVATDFRHVEVRYELERAALRNMGLIATQGSGRRMLIPPELRAQLGSMGVTGVKYVQLDFFKTPVVKLPFRVKGNYIPATSSTMKSLEDNVVRAADRLPELIDQLVELTKRVNHVTNEIEGQRLPQRVSAVLLQTDRTLQLAETKLGQLQVQELSSEARTTLAHLNESLAGADRILARVDGDKGLLASTQRISDSMGDAARNARGFGAELSRTLREVSGAAEAIHEFVEEMHRDPDMLLKGRAEAKR